MVRLLEGDLPERDLNELCRVRVLLDHLRDPFRVYGVQVLVDLVEEVERRGVELLDCEDERHRHEALLPPAEGVEPEDLLVRRVCADQEASLEGFLFVFEEELGLAAFADFTIYALEVLVDG